ncbi:MAG: ABC transporter ATP-binding protein [Candidatus Kapaibacteriota bacterium]
MSQFPRFELIANELQISFDGFQPVFPETSLSLINRNIIGITGLNGSGKSTLIKILAGVLSAHSGKLELRIDNQSIEKEHIPQRIGLVAPYLVLYEEFTPWEHLNMFCSMSGIHFDEKHAKELLELTGLHSHNHKRIGTFSTGMKQRMKYALALIRKPIILLLDEPSTNFDIKGQELFRSIVQKHKELGGGTIIATNEQSETELCDNIISLT